MDYDYLVLSSSGNLVVRPSPAEFVANWDLGVNEEDDPECPWRRFAEADPARLRLAERVGRFSILHAGHEGSLYRRQIATPMFNTIAALVPDWDYDDAYPKEAVFLPTLAVRSRGEAAGTPLRSWVENGEADPSPLPFILSRIPGRRDHQPARRW